MTNGSFCCSTCLPYNTGKPACPVMGEGALLVPCSWSEAYDSKAEHCTGPRCSAGCCAQHVQVDTAIVSVSAQNTSRSCGQRAAPTPSLDLKSVSLRATFDSLTDSNRGRNASARAASGLGAQVSAGHSARQPLSASDTHPSMATATDVGLPLASLSEEPDAVDAGAGYADHAAAQYSGSPTRKVPGEHKGSLSSRHGSGQYASGGSSGYSSGSSSYYSSSSNNSSRSSTPLPNMNNEDSSHGLEKVPITVKTTFQNRCCLPAESMCCLPLSAA